MSKSPEFNFITEAYQKFPMDGFATESGMDFQDGGKKRKGKKGKKNAKKTRKAKKFQEKYGSRLKVWNGTAEMTTGKLKKRDLIRVQDKNGVGRIKSKKKSMFEKKYNRLAKHGWTAKKGEFGAVRIDKKTRKNKKRGKKGKKGNRGFGFF